MNLAKITQAHIKKKQVKKKERKTPDLWFSVKFDFSLGSIKPPLFLLSHVRRKQAKVKEKNFT